MTPAVSSAAARARSTAARQATSGFVVLVLAAMASFWQWSSPGVTSCPARGVADPLLPQKRTYTFVALALHALQRMQYATWTCVPDGRCEGVLGRRCARTVADYSSSSSATARSTVAALPAVLASG